MTAPDQCCRNVKKLLLIKRRPHMTQLYGPAVCCKPNVTDGDDWSCASVSGPVNGAFMLLAIMDIRAHPISFSERP